MISVAKNMDELVSEEALFTRSVLGMILQALSNEGIQSITTTASKLQAIAERAQKKHAGVAARIELFAKELAESQGASPPSSH